MRSKGETRRGTEMLREIHRKSQRWLRLATLNASLLRLVLTSMPTPVMRKKTNFDSLIPGCTPLTSNMAFASLPSVFKLRKTKLNFSFNEAILTKDKENQMLCPS